MAMYGASKELLSFSCFKIFSIIFDEMCLKFDKVSREREVLNYPLTCGNDLNCCYEIQQFKSLCCM